MSNLRMKVKSPAKINWNLRVLGRRPDGFHEIESLVSGVTLFDELTLTTGSNSAVHFHSDLSSLPTDERNLVVKAAMLTAARAEHEANLNCELVKRIPVGGGLGGGSSNAAATLLALNQFWSLDWSTDQLMELAAELGSDVPFFIHGRSAVMSGRGERIEPVEIGFTGWIVLILPDLSIPTPDVYRAWQPDEAEAAAAGLTLPNATDAQEWMEQTFNMLEKPAIKVCSALGGVMGQVSQLADRPVRLSGSGSTMFTAFDDREQAEQFAGILAAKLGLQTHVVQPVEHAKGLKDQ